MNTTSLTIGDMLAFVGLIIAALSLLKPRYSLIWRLTKTWLKRLAAIILVIGYASPLVSMLVPDIKNVWDSLTLQSLIQVIGFVIITVGLLLVAFVFSRWNYRHLLTQYTRFTFRHNRMPQKKWAQLLPTN